MVVEGEGPPSGTWGHSVLKTVRFENADFLRFFCDFLAIFLRFLRQDSRFCTLRLENAAIFLRLRFLGR